MARVRDSVASLYLYICARENGRKLTESHKIHYLGLQQYFTTNHNFS
jgi:hypothetical protein